MTKEEAIQVLQTALTAPFIYGNYAEALDMAIEALSDDAVQGVGRYENAMQKLRDMPRYLNGVKVKQIKKIPSEAVLGEWKPISDGTPQRVGSYLVTCKGEHGFIYVDYDFWTVSDEFKYHHDNVIAWMPLPKPYKGGDTANYTTEKPNDEVEQGNDVVVEPTDLISRVDAVNEIHKYFVEEIDKTPTEIDEDGDELYADMPTVNSLLACNKELSKRIKAIQSADRPSGEWVEKEVMVDEDTDITEWQSAKCSVCGKYHTTPYMYYFDSFNYCPNCGAKMGGNK